MRECFFSDSLLERLKAPGEEKTMATCSPLSLDQAECLYTVNSQQLLSEQINTSHAHKHEAYS